jgi:hypothetical protein
MVATRNTKTSIAHITTRPKRSPVTRPSRRGQRSTVRHAPRPRPCSPYTHGPSIREWLLRPPAAAQRDAARHVSRRNIRLPGSHLGALQLPSSVAHGLHNAIAGHGGAPWPARERRRPRLPSVPGAMGPVLGQVDPVRLPGRPARRLRQRASRALETATAAAAAAAAARTASPATGAPAARRMGALGTEPWALGGTRLGTCSSSSPTETERAMLPDTPTIARSLLTARAPPAASPGASPSLPWRPARELRQEPRHAPAATGTRAWISAQ